MSAFPETRYQCDCCFVEATMPVQNTPVHTRAAGPEGWTAMTIGTEPNTPLTHLCGACSVRFSAFMGNEQP